MLAPDDAWSMRCAADDLAIKVCLRDARARVCALTGLAQSALRVVPLPARVADYKKHPLYALKRCAIGERGQLCSRVLRTDI
jgi:hypothetical protein